MSGHEIAGIVDYFRHMADGLKGKDKEYALDQVGRIRDLMRGFTDLTPYYSTHSALTKEMIEKSIKQMYGWGVTIKLGESLDLLGGDKEHHVTEHVFFTTLHVIMNNALYFARDKNGRDSVVSIDYEDGKIFVSDNGPGISEKDLPKLFSYGFTNRRGGHGFGLALCTDYAKANMMDVDYEPEAAINTLGGACFSITLKKNFGKQ